MVPGFKGHLGQPAYPGTGDNVMIVKVVNFDSTTSDLSVTASNLDLEGGNLNVSGPGALSMAGTNSYWNGGGLQGPLLQLGSLTLAGTNTVGGSGFLSNQGVVYQSANATLNLDWGSHVQNLSDGDYYFQGDGAIVNIGIYYIYFGNQGLLCKRGGSGTSTLGVYLENYYGTWIQVASATNRKRLPSRHFCFDASPFFLWGKGLHRNRNVFSSANCCWLTSCFVALQT